jgi:hypothetical protein
MPGLINTAILARDQSELPGAGIYHRMHFQGIVDVYIILNYRLCHIPATQADADP